HGLSASANAVAERQRGDGMSRNQPPGGQAPVVQRIRLRYAKRGPLRFTSHRDFARAFERALHRAGVPIAYSQGFSPHPKVSYASASPTGAASGAEYLEIGLRARAAVARSEAVGRPSGAGDAPCAILGVVIRQVTPSVRPDDVLSGVRVVVGLEPPVPPRATRLAQGMLTAQGEITDPLLADRTG